MENKIKISVQKASSAPKPVKTSRRSVMDFVPDKKSAPRIITPKITEAERTRREIAKEQISRREAIHRQIEAQNEADILAKRRADAARRELARQRAVAEEADRVRAEKEAERAEAMRLERHQALLEERERRQAMMQRREQVAKRRAEAAKRELLRRQSEAQMKQRRAIHIENPVGSVDPIALKTPEPEPSHKTPEKKPKAAPISEFRPSRATQAAISARRVTVKPDTAARRVFGRITKTKQPATQAEADYRALHPESLGDVDDFAEEVNEYFYDDFVSADTAFDETIYDELTASKTSKPSKAKNSNDSTKSANFSDTPIAPQLPNSQSVAQSADARSATKNNPTTKSTAAPTRANEDASANNYSYILGGKSPFINLDRIEKRPLSGNSAGVGASGLQRPGFRQGKLLGGPNQGDYVSPAESRHSHEQTTSSDRAELHTSRATSSRYVPYEEPIPHKTLYARRVKESKDEKADIPTMVVAENDKGSSVALTVVILLTVVLGAVVGVIVYLAFFQ